MHITHVFSVVCVWYFSYGSMSVSNKQTLTVNIRVMLDDASTLFGRV